MNMKKLFIALIMYSIWVNKLSAKDRGYTALSDIGPSFISTTSINAVSLSAGGGIYRNCLEYITFFSTSAYTLYILNGQTTSYQLTLGASVVHQPLLTGNDFCGSANTSMTIKSSTTVSGASNQINWKGYVGY